MEQMVARRAHNPKVVGSSPAPATTQNGLNTTFKPFFFFVKKFVKISISNTFLTQCLLNGVRSFYFELKIKKSSVAFEGIHPICNAFLYMVMYCYTIAILVYTIHQALKTPCKIVVFRNCQT